MDDRAPGTGDETRTAVPDGTAVRDALIGWARTAVPPVVGCAAAWLGLPTTVPGWAVAWFGFVAGQVWYITARFLEADGGWPALVGRWMLGGAGGPPRYGRQ